MSLSALVSTPCHLKPCMRFSLTRVSDNLLPEACEVPCRTFSTTTRHRFGLERAVDSPLATGHSLRGSCRDLWNWWNWPFRACTVTYLPALARLKQGSFPPIELCCLDDHQYCNPLRLLTRRTPGLRIHVLIPGVTRDVGLRPREISLVALPTFPTFRSPYAGEFFEAASPESSPLPWPSLWLRSSALPCPLSGLTCRRCRIPIMVRTAGLHLLLGGILRFATPGYPRAAGACYVALWRLPRPDFHR